MSLMYHVITNNYLHRSKKLFDCYCKAQDFIQKIVKMSEQKLTKKQVKQSVKITRIEEELCPNYKKIFLESEIKEPLLEADDIEVEEKVE